YEFTLRAVGMLSRDKLDKAITVSVFDPFSLDSFTVSADRIKLGEEVTLSWTATNADSATIEAIPGGSLSLPATPNGGSVKHKPQKNPRYVLTIERLGRTGTEERVVEVRTAWFENVQFSRTELLRDSGSITVEWELEDPTGTARVVMEPDPYVLREVSDEV